MAAKSSENSRIFTLLFAIGRRMRDEGKKHRARTPLYSMLHFQTLRYVAEHGRPYMHDVASYLCVTPPAATLLIDGMVKDKLLVRTMDARDRRSVRLALTSRGKKFLIQGIRKKTGKLKILLAAALTAKERTAFAAILEKILAQA